MAVSNNRKRIMVTVSTEMADRIEFYSNKMGVSMSALCSQLVGQAIMGYDKAFDLVDEMSRKLMDEEYKKAITEKSE